MTYRLPNGLVKVASEKKKTGIFFGYRKIDDVFSKNAKNINTKADIFSKFQLYAKTIKISLFIL